jgi:hypothetical protein
MTLGMLRRTVLVLALAAVALPATGAAAHRPYDPDLWATVNSCDAPGHPAAMGVRVAIPPRYRGESQWMRVRVEWGNAATGTWSLAPGADTGWKKVGDGTELVEAGTTFHFTPPVAGHWLVLRGLLDVQWRQGRKMRATARTRTMPGHIDATDPLLWLSQGLCYFTR